MANGSEHNRSNPQFLGHPVGLYVCFLTEMWERFSFYGMKALLLLYITKYHLFSDEHGLNLLGAYGGLVYAVPVIGGLLADRYLGMRKAVVFGAILLVCGHAGMAIEGTQARLVDGQVVRDEWSLQIFYLSLSLIIVGVGFLKPNISTIVGQLYPANDARRDSGFTIFYAGINLGAFAAALFCGWLGETYGWRWGFGAAGIGMVLGLVVFLAGQRYLLGKAEPPDPQRLKQRVWGPISLEYAVYVSTLLGLAVIWMLIQGHSVIVKIIPRWLELSPVLLTMHAVSLCVIVVIVRMMISGCDWVERQRMIVLFVLIVLGTIFFALYEQTAGSWTLFSDRTMNRWAFGYEWKASQLQSLGALFIFVLTPLFAWLWPQLEKRGWNPTKPVKSGLGLIFAGLAFLVLAWSAKDPGAAGGMTTLASFVLAYFILEIGEIMLSPIGLSAVTQLSVPRIVGLMMGAWFLGTSYAEILAAGLGKMAAIDEEALKTLVLSDALDKYYQLFLFSAQIGIISGAMALVISPLLNRWMHGIK